MSGPQNRRGRIVRADAGSPIPAAADPATFRAVEQWMARELLRRIHRDVLAGVTDEHQRKEQLRQAIKHHELEEAIAGRAHDNGRPMTWRVMFERLYGEKL